MHSLSFRFVTLLLSKAAAIAPVSPLFLFLYTGSRFGRGCSILGKDHLSLVAVTVGYVQVFAFFLQVILQSALLDNVFDGEIWSTEEPARRFLLSEKSAG